MTPHVPITPKEIINDVLQCAGMGVSMVHLHARDNNEIPTYKKEIYAEIISGIRTERPDLVIIASTSGRTYSEFEQRSDALNLKGDLKLDMASLTLSSLNFPQSASVNSPSMIIKLATIMKENGIKPELEVFDLGMVNYAKFLIKKGILEQPFYFNIFLGSVSSAQATLMHAALIISELPPNSFYSLTGIGEYQKPMNALGIIVADGVRVGLEDNIWLDKKLNKLETNASLVHRVVQISKALERRIATPKDVRIMLEL